MSQARLLDVSFFDQVGAQSVLPRRHWRAYQVRAIVRLPARSSVAGGHGLDTPRRRPLRREYLNGTDSSAAACELVPRTRAGVGRMNHAGNVVLQQFAQHSRRVPRVGR